MGTVCGASWTMMTDDAETRLHVTADIHWSLALVTKYHLQTLGSFIRILKFYQEDTGYFLASYLIFGPKNYHIFICRLLVC